MSALIKEAVEQIIRDKLPAILEAKLPGFIRKYLTERFAQEPGLSLTPAGFRWAFVIALQRHWPDVTGKTAALWLDDYLPVQIGAPGYEWTPRAASELAAMYVSEFGEAP